MSEPQEPPYLLFRMAAAALTAVAFYRVVGATVEMGLTLVPTVGNPSPWRSFTCPLDSAVSQAEEMCDEAAHYLLDVLDLDIRDVEDLDFDDFIHHLSLRVSNEFH